ncbi:hypothetical protein BJAS_P2083 [Bathymodiolus japonicus methanotrophic gill symbiont]|uniref:hypothetical protein n=1 Tax=Bathymodiolus japonicus methanotrophic gill symbiont TaxID=113269 RepID=UPI001B3F614F|nr:hypothetical protein [Bathymodiolus japonicus methanotrophic gill symbiont]GFO72109.1 hypothetical protein BJAS_P2083 [Bathymodiolus japonicus methanotrophic gill symbiont]
MSEDKSTDEIIENVKEVVEEAVDAVEDAVDAAKPPLMKLKEENPKVFYGGIAAIAVVAGLFFFSGGSSNTQHVQQIAHTVGETYTLQAPNATPGSGVTLKILKIPGQMASFDTESEDVVCNAPSGTRATIKSFQEAFGKKNLFAHIEILDAVNDCRQGVKGWTLTTNLK